MEKSKSGNKSRIGLGPIPKDPPRIEDYLGDGSEKKTNTGKKKINGGGGTGKTPVKSVGKKVTPASKPSKPTGIQKPKTVEKVSKATTSPSKKGKNWWPVIGLLILVALLLRFLFFSQFTWTGRGYVVEPSPVPVAEVKEEEVEEKFEKAEDVAVARFSDLGMFLIDGDPLVKNFKVEGAEMEYICSTDNGVFISMDPGVVQGYDTGDLGAVVYVECSKGSKIVLQTDFWNDYSKHNSIHLVEMKDSLSSSKAVEVLKTYKVDEGKPLALFIKINGEVNKY
ncbi:hypothetical protein GYA37_03805 [candidate division WWE3 bacterium]|uniref:Uncharacterized protein n=1 Tax=candidate division WWE3 bacterium TaxID=2053526 RepID=A0A7X9HT71_UNCKA|nr:hypothetical protein [candidate division WWE3 bacterium]